MVYTRIQRNLFQEPRGRTAVHNGGAGFAGDVMGMKIEDQIPLEAVPTTRNRAMLSVFWRGVRDAESGKHHNPYKDHRGGVHNHIITFSRAFRSMWKRGHDEAMKILK